MTNRDDTKIVVDLEIAKNVLRTEAAAVLALVDHVDKAFSTAVEKLALCQGRVVLTGMGKSGIIARKIAATLSSTGTPSHFLHPAEAVHGDLGAIQSDDVIVALSQSGETSEILRFLETIRRLGAVVIAITGSPSSSLGQAADVTLHCMVNAEACPMNLAPTASTTAALALGDALAMTLLISKGFQEEDFAHLHPGGHLGKRLIRVERLMHSGQDCPTVGATTPMEDVVSVISNAGYGMVCVITGSDELVGIITDGDIRRRLVTDPDLIRLTASDVMTTAPLTIPGSALAVEALRDMEQNRVTSLVVVHNDNRLAGFLHLHDLWRTDLF